MICRDKVTLKRITYGELRENKYDLNGDNYNIISDYFIDSTRSALLENPNYDNDSKSVLNVVYYNEEIVGRHMLMPTKIKVGDKIVLAQTGGGHEIYENFQGEGLGTIVVKDTIINSEYPIYLGQLYSSGAISILRKMDLCIFEKPLYQKMLKTRSIFKSKGYKGFLLLLLSFMGDINLKIHDLPNKTKIRKLKKRYIIKRETIVPTWVNNLTINDRYKYMEVHDQKWLQWNLSNVFSNNPDDKNYFFSIYDKKGLPVGFYMTKERFEENKKGKFKNLIRGTIVEWDIKDKSGLSEADINLMAISTFSRKIDKINTVLSCNRIEKEIKNMGYTYRGNYQMVLKPAEDCETDIYNINLWRIRYGGANTILV